MRGCFLGCLAEIGLQRRKKNKTSNKTTMSNNISHSNKHRNTTMLRILKVKRKTA